MPISAPGEAAGVFGEARQFNAITALPGLVPTVNFNGTRYIDGGVRSADNVDLASGHVTVLVLSPLGGRSGTVPEGQFEDLRRQGSHADVITPDGESRAAMSTNRMDPATRTPPPMPLSLRARRNRLV